ncbi:MAG TPA: hypothetical protein VFI59_00840 [Actinomycetota bacterium]|nr:hypothetical protein [Actinomycetota bacterium]
MDDAGRPAGRWWRSRSSRSGAPESEEASVEAHPVPDAPAVDDADMALVEMAHERDVSIARASEAEERERLVRDRLASLGPLEQRVEIAERRVRDAERRLDEIGERIAAATQHGAAPSHEGTPEPSNQDATEDPSSEPADDAARLAADLRERLARTAARKRAARGRR